MLFRSGQAVWTFAPASGSTKSVCLAYDYRFQPGRWASWGRNSAYVNANCLAIMQTSSRKHRLYAGATNGYAYQLDIADRAINTATPYTADVKTPFLNFGTSSMKKNAEKGFWSFLPKGNYNFTFGYTRDQDLETTTAIAQSGGDALG